MALIIQGGTSGVNANVDTDAHLMVNVRPPAFGALGYYQLAAVSGTIAATLAANSNLFTFRWTSSTDLAVIQSIKVGGIETGSAGTGADFDLAVYFARSYTASASGGTSVLPTGNGNKLRTSMGTTLAGDIRIASTAGFTAGTWTLDTNPLARIQGESGLAAGNQLFPGPNPTPLFLRDNVDHHPIVLAQNEGIVVQNPLAASATSTWVLMVQITWGEVAAY